MKFKLSNLFSFSSKHSTTREKKSVVKDFTKEFKLDGILGKGGFGTVHSATRISDGMQVAVKEVMKENMSEDVRWRWGAIRLCLDSSPFSLLGGGRERGEIRIPL